MSRKEPKIFEDVDSSEQTIRLVKDVPVDGNSKETKEVDVLADFKDEVKEEPKPTKNIKVVEVSDEEDIPFEPTRELKIKRTNSYNENDEYREKVIVDHSENYVGVKKIIIGDETTTLPVYKKPKKDFQTILRDVFIYLMMVAIVSILVILLLKYCNKEDKDTLLDISTSTTTTTTITSSVPSTETTTTLTTNSVKTETTTTSSTKKHGLAIPQTPKPTKSTKTTAKPNKPAEKPAETPIGTTEPTEKPTTTEPPTEPSKPEEPTTTNPPDESDNQG